MLAGGVFTTALTTCGLTNSVQAAQFSFSYSGTGVDASGVLTTTDTPNSGGFLTITDITGQRNGSAITAILAPGSFPNDNPPNGVPNDNLFSATEPFLTFNGFSYLVGSQPENVFFYPTVGQYAETDDPNGDPVNYRILNNFSVQAATPVPEPSSMLGLLALGTLGARSILKKKQSACQKSATGLL